MTLRRFSYPLLLSTALVFSAPLAFGQEADSVPNETANQTAEEPPVEEVPPEPEADRTLEAVVVRGEFIPEPQRATSQVASFLSSDDLVRQGDSNAALALTRLSGLSVVGGKFAFVRGLGDRYSAATLNGSPLPSPEPLRRTVPLDLFPSSVLEGAAVQKTYSANLPGEFGGGLINLETLRRPRESFFTAKYGIAANDATTGKTGIFVRGSDTDWSGYDDGLRNIPGPLQALLSSGTSLSGQTPAQIEAVGESLVNSPVSVIQSGELGPDQSASLEGGLRFDRGEFDFGLTGVLAFDTAWTTKEAIRQQVDGGLIGNDLTTFSTSLDTTVSGLASASVGRGNHDVQATLFYVHTGSSEAQISTGTDFNAPGNTGEVFDESTGFYERELTFLQLRGDHEFGDIELTWRGATALSTRDAPYERSLRRLVDETGTPLYSVANNYGIRFSELEDTINSFGADAAYRLSIGGSREAVLSAGFDTSATERTYDFLGLRFVGGNALPDDVQVARPDFLFSPDNISPDRFILQEIITPNDSYAAELDVNAFYVQADIDLIDYVKGTFGVRLEDAEQAVRTFDRFGNPGAGDVNLSNEYVLPAATLTWNFADDLQLRAGYSKTIARPQFRELALSAFLDPETDRVYRGNSGLVDTELQNFDARLEYYMGRNQFITVAGFFKDITNPIEEVQYSTASFVFETTFINSPKAELYGLELEYRTRFEMPLPGAFFDAREWLFSTNYTYTSSEVQAAEGQLIFDPVLRTPRDAALFGLDGSELQGTPENIVNLQFGWESDVDQLTLLVGFVDDRILQRGFGEGSFALPNVVEEPGTQVDLVYRRNFNIGGRDLEFGLSGRNLLDEQHIEYQETEELGRTNFNTYDRGRSVSASISAKF
jgi:outer membrane receptor protein involved in Fe transport